MLGALHGDFGTSYSYKMPVSGMLAGKLPVTGLLTGMSFVLILVFSIPLGIFTARHAGGRMDKALTSVNQVLMAIPAFVTGILLTYVFGLVLRLFVPGNYGSPGDNFGASLWYFLFPAVSIALPRVAMTVKMLRSSILSEMEKDYVRTSHSRGNSDRATLYRHVLRNAMGPVVSFLAMTVADIVAGSVVIEQVFSLPGLGRHAADLHRQPGLSRGAGGGGDRGLLGGAGESAGGPDQPAAGPATAAAIEGRDLPCC
ncbi:MAG: ABC transporter permease [Oscillospiraceae bacterium]